MRPLPLLFGCIESIKLQQFLLELQYLISVTYLLENPSRRTLRFETYGYGIDPTKLRMVIQNYVVRNDHTRGAILLSALACTEGLYKSF